MDIRYRYDHDLLGPILKARRSGEEDDVLVVDEQTGIAYTGKKGQHRALIEDVETFTRDD